MYLVVCYDVVCNRRRTRLAKRLRENLRRVQKSVFEGALDDERVSELRTRIMDEIDPDVDTVRIYHLCARCHPATELLGTSIFVDVEDADEVY